jgi:hypothetical protein
MNSRRWAKGKKTGKARGKGGFWIFTRLNGYYRFLI